MTFFHPINASIHPALTSQQKELKEISSLFQDPSFSTAFFAPPSFPDSSIATSIDEKKSQKRPFVIIHSQGKLSEKSLPPSKKIKSLSVSTLASDTPKRLTIAISPLHDVYTHENSQLDNEVIPESSIDLYDDLISSEGSPTKKEWMIIKNMLTLSQSYIWKNAVNEWEIIGSTYLEVGEESETCICGHNPIRQIFHVKNKINGHTAKVGNVCIRLFENIAPNDKQNNIFKSLKELKRNPKTSVSDELLEFSVNQNVLTPKEKEFYLSIQKKRLLTSSFAEKKANLNNTMLLALATSSKQTFLSIKENPYLSAGPKLIHLSFEKKALNQDEKEFYLKIWNKAPQDLSPFDKEVKLQLNNQITNSADLNDYFEIISSLCLTPKPSSDSDSSFD